MAYKMARETVMDACPREEGAVSRITQSSEFGQLGLGEWDAINLGVIRQENAGRVTMN